jgi:hypothetical protein
MTRTEERLRDALRTSAGRVRDDRLRPLPDPALGAEHRARRAARWAWLTPVAAAASVALIVGLAVTMAGRSGQATRGTPVASGSANGTVGFPAYFADFTGSMPGGLTLQVRSTSTGTMVASARFPVVRGWQLALDTVAAAPGAGTFYVSYDAVHLLKSSFVEQTWIYRLSITGPASATVLTRIKGGEIGGTSLLGTGGTMVVSPDGTQLALTADTADQLNVNSPGWADKIVIIDLLTGAHRVWQGGLYRSGKTFTIPDISWTQDGRSLVFLALWCDFPAASNLCIGTQSGSNGYRDTQVRSLSVATGGGALGSGALLLTQSARYPVIADAIAGPEAGQLNIVVLSGHASVEGTWSKVAVERVAAVSGALLGVAYRATASGGEGQPGNVGISADPSGQYLLFSYGGRGGLYTGWIGQGRLHFLPVKQPYLGLAITAW